METKNPEKNPKYNCKKCDMNTNNKKDFERHLLTAKHKKLSNVNTLLTEKPHFTPIDKFICCECNKQYYSRVGLWKHKKKCIQIPYIIENNDTKQLTDLVLKVVEKNQELTNQIIELSKNGNSTSINHSTINSNNKFNLNLYLNETCKNAINISDFVSSLALSISDLEDTARLGYAEGISNIFLNGLKDLDVHFRPVHCTDQKRETLYIKDNDEWIKDTDNKETLTKAIKQVAHKNIKQISEWQKLNPEYNDPSSKQNDKYQKILFNAMSGSTKEESDKNYEKIIRNVVKNTTIEK